MGLTVTVSRCHWLSEVTRRDYADKDYPAFFVKKLPCHTVILTTTTDSDRIKNKHDRRTVAAQCTSV